MKMAEQKTTESTNTEKAEGPPGKLDDAALDQTSGGAAPRPIIIPDTDRAVR
jgi:hypothetical protein